MMQRYNGEPEVIEIDMDDDGPATVKREMVDATYRRQSAMSPVLPSPLRETPNNYPHHQFAPPPSVMQNQPPPPPQAQPAVRCCQCGKEIRVERHDDIDEALTNHITRTHIGSGWFPFECTYCNESEGVRLPTLNALKRHQRQFHPHENLVVKHFPEDDKERELKSLIARSYQMSQQFFPPAPSYGNGAYGAPTMATPMKFETPKVETAPSYLDHLPDTSFSLNASAMASRYGVFAPTGRFSNTPTPNMPPPTQQPPQYGQQRWAIPPPTQPSIDMKPLIKMEMRIKKEEKMDAGYDNTVKPKESRSNRQTAGSKGRTEELGRFDSLLQNRPVPHSKKQKRKSASELETDNASAGKSQKKRRSAARAKVTNNSTEDENTLTCQICDVSITGDNVKNDLKLHQYTHLAEINIYRYVCNGNGRNCEFITMSEERQKWEAHLKKFPKHKIMDHAATSLEFDEQYRKFVLGKTKAEWIELVAKHKNDRNIQAAEVKQVKTEKTCRKISETPTTSSTLSNGALNADGAVKDTRSFICAFCNKGWKGPTELKGHQLNYVSKLGIYRFVCAEEGCGYKGMKTHTRHRQTNHKVDDNKEQVEEAYNKYILNKSKEEWTKSLKEFWSKRANDQTTTRSNEQLTPRKTTKTVATKAIKTKSADAKESVISVPKEQPQQPSATNDLQCRICPLPEEKKSKWKRSDEMAAYRASTQQHMRNHYMRHLADDFAIRQFMCVTESCQFASHNDTSVKTHKLNRKHETVDHSDLADRAYQKAASCQSRQEYLALEGFYEEIRGSMEKRKSQMDGGTTNKSATNTKAVTQLPTAESDANRPSARVRPKCTILKLKSFGEIRKEQLATQRTDVEKRPELAKKTEEVNDDGGGKTKKTSTVRKRPSKLPRPIPSSNDKPESEMRNSLRVLPSKSSNLEDFGALKAGKTKTTVVQADNNGSEPISGDQSSLDAVVRSDPTAKVETKRHPLQRRRISGSIKAVSKKTTDAQDGKPPVKYFIAPAVNQEAVDKVAKNATEPPPVVNLVEPDHRQINKTTANDPPLVNLELDEEDNLLLKLDAVFSRSTPADGSRRVRRWLDLSGNVDNKVDKPKDIPVPTTPSAKKKPAKVESTPKKSLTLIPAHLIKHDKSVVRREFDMQPADGSSSSVDGSPASSNSFNQTITDAPAVLSALDVPIPVAPGFDDQTEQDPCWICQRRYTEFTLERHVQAAHMTKEIYRCSVKGCTVKDKFKEKIESHLLMKHLRDETKRVEEIGPNFKVYTDLMKKATTPS